jgi:hypothetical protein
MKRLAWVVGLAGVAAAVLLWRQHRRWVHEFDNQDAQ